MNVILKGVFTQNGYSKKTGLSPARISQKVKDKEVKLVYTEDGKALIKEG